MKKIYTLISALVIGLSSFAQAPVPTSYDFEGGLPGFPTGWAFTNANSSNDFYTTTATACAGTYALRFDIANDLLVINTLSQPGAITFKIRANTGGATPWAGNYQVQESTNGTTWTAIKTFTNGMIDAQACQSETVTPTNPNSRYVRFIYVTKTTGNIALDEVNIAEPVVPVGIRVKQGAEQISNGGFITPVSVAVSSTSVIALTVQNYGNTNVLNVSASAITGANASEFVITSPTTFSVATGTNQTFNIDFTPTAAGTRTATLTFTNDDPNNTSFVVKLYGTGGTFATAPSAQATGLTFPVNKTYRIRGQFTTVNSSLDELGGYLILRNNSGAVTDVPTDGNTYQRGQYIGASQVVFAGPISAATASFSPSFIRASKTYGFAIFTYNGSGSVTKYNTSAPLTGSVTTPFSMMPGTEYASINTAASTFLADLSALINPHTSIFYANYANTMVNRFETRDTLVTSPVLFTKVVNCSYSGQIRTYNDPFDFSALDFSREHTYPHSWMPTFPADNPEKPEYNDQHNLYLARQTNVNAVRSNFPLGVVTGTPQSSFLDSKFGNDASGNKVFEPRTSHKGNAARAIMYMATAYNGVSSNNWKLKNPISGTIAYGQDQNILKKWHFDDLPDSYERSRNDFVDSLQGNRNPFIDSVRYACYIDFTTMTYIANPQSPCYSATTTPSSIKENVKHFEYVLMPNPSNGAFNILIDVNNLQGDLNLEITDVSGKIVYVSKLDVENGFNNITIQDINLNSGIYFVNMNYKNEKTTKKLIIQ
jgi:hypothetical protein